MDKKGISPPNNTYSHRTDYVMNEGCDGLDVKVMKDAYWEVIT
jgi:hypothetical protein